VLTVFWDIGVVSRLTAMVVDEALDGLGVTAREYALISVVRAQGPLTPTEVSERTGIPAPSVSRMVRSLHDRGLLREGPNPEDRRSRIVSITEDGIRLIADAQNGFGRAHRAFYELLGDDVTDLVWSLRRAEWALRRLVGQTPLDEAGIRSRLPNWIRYSGPPLTPDEEAEAVRFLDWLVWRREQR
jgi:DNA-binding MarR family transcriptional regulator